MTDEAKKIRAILTPEFRLSFMSLYEPQADMNGVIRYQMEMLFPKERGGSQFKEMLEIYNEALANAKFSSGGPAPRTFKEAIIDGNSKKQGGRHGNFMLKAVASKEINGTPNKVKLLLPNRMPAGPGDIYEGCWCRAILTAFTYEARKDGKANAPIISRGANFNIITVQKVRDDKPFASRISDTEIDAMLAAAPIEGAEDDLDAMLS
jgi:hypothetical protein